MFWWILIRVEIIQKMLSDIGKGQGVLFRHGNDKIKQVQLNMDLEFDAEAEDGDVQ